MLRYWHRFSLVITLNLAIGLAITFATPGIGLADTTATDSALDQALEEAEKSQTIAEPTRESSVGILSQKLGSRTTLRLLDIGLSGVVSAGGSTEPDNRLRLLQGSAHDPSKRGFNVQSFELSMAGAVDPYFRARAGIEMHYEELSGETILELEELYAVTQALPWGFQVRGGYYATDFGITNTTHPGHWDWLDAPVIHTRLMGNHAMRAPGAVVSWLVPLPFYLNTMFGVQNATGEHMVSFLASDEVYDGRAPGGRPYIDRPFDGLEELLYSARIETAGSLGGTLHSKLGASWAYGPNSTGTEGATTLAGVDLKLKYQPKNHFRGYPFVTWQTEFMYRDFQADQFFDPVTAATTADDIFLPPDRLHDYGFYTQLLYGFYHRWETGMRFEMATGDAPSIIGRNLDPFRADRLRLSPMVAFRPTEFSRLRLQANYDNADHLPADSVLSVWVGLDFILGVHPPHTF